MIFRRLNVKGGTQRQGLMLANELKKRGHEVIIYTLSLNMESCYPELLKGFKIVELPNEERGASYYPGLRGNILTVKKENSLSRQLAELMDSDFDILNPHDQVSYKVAYYYKKLKKEIPSVWNMNDLPLRKYGYDRARSSDDRVKRPFYKIIAYRIFDWYEKFFFIRYQDAIIVVDFFNRELVRKYLGLKAFTVRSGPDFEHFSYEEKYAPDKELKLLTSGILMPHRRYQDAINALPHLIKAGFNPHLTIIGDTENDIKYYKFLKELVESQALDKSVTFAGKVSEQELISAYHTNNIYIFQHHMQSDGLSPFEAAACGMPLVISKTAGCHEVMTDGKDALLIEPKNPDDIAEKVLTLSRNPELFKKMAKNANNFVRSNFGWPKYTDGVLSVMEKTKQGTQIKF